MFWKFSKLKARVASPLSPGASSRWLVKFRVPGVVIGGLPEVRWTLDLWEQPVVRFAGRLVAFRVSLGCFFKFVRRWRDKVLLVMDLGWPTVTVTAGEFHGGFFAGEFSGHWNLVGNSPSNFFRVRINRFLSWWCCYLRPVSGFLLVFSFSG